METVRMIEKQLVEINKGLPKLPRGLTKWLAEYGWLLVLIGVILSVLSLFILLPTLLTVLGVLSITDNIFGLNYGFGTLSWISFLVTLIATVIVTYLEAVAITPLKTKQYRGWELVFIAGLVSVASSIISSVISLEAGSLVVSLMFYAVGLYVLFQVREYFVPHTAKDKQPTKKPDFKAAPAKSDK